MTAGEARGHFLVGFWRGVLLASILWGLVMVMGCDVDWKGDEILPRPAVDVTMTWQVYNSGDGPVRWYLSCPAGKWAFDVAAQTWDTQSITCREGMIVCHAFSTDSNPPALWERDPNDGFGGCHSCGQKNVRLELYR